MQHSGNTILVTGGASGIGRALAEAFLADGNQVIIAGRRQDKLDQAAAAHPGLHTAVLDIADAQDIERFAQQLLRDHPALNVVIHNAGIMRMEPLGGADLLADAEATVATNLLGPIRLTAALLPALRARPQATLMTVSSGLAFVPMAATPTYCATKAAIHSYTEALRYQLQGSSVQVIELIPPYVQTELIRPEQASDPHAMPLNDFIAETMALLRATPDIAEVVVERVKPLRHAATSGNYAGFFQQFNQAMDAAMI